MLQPLAAVMPQSRHQSGGYWSLQPLCRSLTAAASLQRCYVAATGCSNAPVPSPIRGLLGPAVLVLQPMHHSPLAARLHAAVTAGVPQSRYQSRDYWSLQPLCRSLTAAASLQRCYVAATGCSNAPVPSPIRGLLGPAVLVLQPMRHSSLAARLHAAVTAGVPQSRYQSRDYWSLQPLCCSLTAAASLQRCYVAATGCSNAPVPSPIKGLLGPAALVLQSVHQSPLAARSHAAVTAGVPQSRYQSRDYWSLQPLCRSLTAAASLQRCYVAATGCSNAPVPSPIRGLLGPAVLVLQPMHHSPLAARSHAAVTAGVPQSRYQSRDYWSLQPLCRSLTAAASLQRCYVAATGCSNAPVPSPIRGLLGPAVLVLQPMHHRPLAARSHAAVTAGVPQSRYQSRDYWSLQPLCRSLTAAASLQRCYVAATGCSNAPVPSPIRGLLGPAVHVLQPMHHRPLAARSHAAVTAGVPQSRYQSREYWSLQPLCCSLTAAASLQRCYVAATGCSNAPVPSPIRGLLGPAVLVPQPVHHSPLAAHLHAAVTAGVPQSRYQSRDYWSLQPLCRAEVLCLHSRGLVPPQRRSCASTTEVLCLHRGGVVPPPRRSCASTAEVLCLHNGGLVPPPRSLTAAASLQRCYVAATGCSNAPVPSPRKGLLGPAVLVLQPVHHSPLAARSHAAVTAGVPQSHYQSRDYWSLQPLCCSLTAAASLQRCYAAATGCSNAPVPSPIRGLLGPAVLVLQPMHHSPLAARLHAAVTAGVPQSRYQSRDYWSLQPLCRSLTAAASLQRCYAAATGCSNAPVLSPIRGLLGPAVLVLQPMHHSPLAARLHAAVTAGVPQSRYQSRDYWSLQPLCRSLTAAASLQRCYAAATGCSNAQSCHQSRGYWGLQPWCCSLCTRAHWQHVRMLQSLQECPSPVTNQGTIGACSPCVAA